MNNVQNKSGTFYLVPTPIGNIKEVSPRIYETLNMVLYIFCEDTRNTNKLLGLMGINNKKQLLSCHKFNEKEVSSKVINLLKEGNDVAYVSDAGYPGISDPGSILVKEIIKEDIKIIPLSGPSASLSSLVASGMDTDHFIFYGFFSSNKSNREKEIYSIMNLPYTIILYEAPHRVNETIDDLYKIVGNRKLTIVRELTKLHEEFIYTSLKEASENHKEYKGELVLVLEGNKIEKTNDSIDINSIIFKYNELIKNGINNKDAITALSVIYEIKKNKIKEILLDEKRD